MKNKLKKRINANNLVFLVLLLTVLFLVVLFLIFIVSVTIHILKDSSEKTFSKKKIGLYQYFQYNPSTESKSTGFVNIGSEEIDDFLSYRDGNGNYMLISNFETDIYHCTGSCYCEEERRSSTAIPLRKGLIYLVVGITSIIATSRAKDHFEKECEEIYGDKCPPNAIRADVDGCESSEPISSQKDDSDTQGSTRKTYFCNGNCLKFSFYYGKRYYFLGEPIVGRLKESDSSYLRRLQNKANAFGCDDLELSKAIGVTFPPELIETINNDIFLPPKAKRLKVAEQAFMKQYLHEYCLRNSPFDVKSDTELRDVESTFFGKSGSIPMCRGHVGNDNPLVKCIEDLKS